MSVSHLARRANEFTIRDVRNWLARFLLRLAIWIGTDDAFYGMREAHERDRASG